MLSRKSLYTSQAQNSIPDTKTAHKEFICSINLHVLERNREEKERGCVLGWKHSQELGLMRDHVQGWSLCCDDQLYYYRKFGPCPHCWMRIKRTGFENIGKRNLLISSNQCKVADVTMCFFRGGGIKDGITPISEGSQLPYHEDIQAACGGERACDQELRPLNNKHQLVSHRRRQPWAWILQALSSLQRTGAPSDILTATSWVTGRQNYPPWRYQCLRSL